MLNQAPCEWTIAALQSHFETGPKTSHDGKTWEPARPYGFFGFGSRFRLAWLVFTVRADALRWPGDGPKAY